MGKQNLRFGWKANQNADGFEAEHGRFVVEVWWNGSWYVNVWNEHNTIVQSAKVSGLDEGKMLGHEIASRLEKELMLTKRVDKNNA